MIEEYAKKVHAFPIDNLKDGPMLHECADRHLILATKDEMLAGKKCAHCNGYKIPELQAKLRTIPFKLVGHTTNKKGEVKALLEDSRGRHIFRCEDIVNGLTPDRQFPAKFPANWLYYMKFIRNGELYYKVGISHNPFTRLKELKPTILYFHRYVKEQSARLAEQAIIKNNKEFTAKHELKGLVEGYSETFTKDVLGLDNVLLQKN